VDRHVAPRGTAGDDGSGIMLGRSVGGACARLETVSAWRFLYPPAGWSKGVLVGPDGKRIVNEEAYGARTGAAMFERAGGRAWLVMDDELLNLTRRQAKDRALLGYQRITIGAALRIYARSAPTLAGLARKIGLPGDKLTKTIQQYNSDIEAGRPDQFGKASALCMPVLKAPFTAVDLSHHTRLNPLLGITVGGLRVDETSGAVLDGNGLPIAGLFAAGRTAVGLPSNLYVSGLSLSDCLWSGWRAAEAATATDRVRTSTSDSHS
jgi:3-oxo-5alpha-steroid 4-dehydrogenase